MSYEPRLRSDEGTRWDIAHIGEAMCNARVTLMRLLVLAAVNCLGCSFAFVTGPPSEPPDDPREPIPECTTSVVFPVLDGAAATIAGISLIIVATDDRGDAIMYGAEVEQETAIALTAAQLAAFGAGSVYGFIQTSRCRSFREESERARRPTCHRRAPPKVARRLSPAK